MTTSNVAPVSNVAPKTNVLAIVSLVLSIIGFNIVAIILGFVAMNQVKKTGENGRGLALAAVIIGFAEIVIGIIIVIVVVSATQACVDSGACVVTNG